MNKLEKTISIKTSVSDFMIYEISIIDTETKQKQVTELNLHLINNINENDLKSTAIEHVKYYGIIATFKALCVKQLNYYKLDFEKKIAKMDLELREDYNYSKIKFTEKTIKSAIEQTDEYENARSELNKTEDALETLLAMLETLRHKRDMIQHIKDLYVSDSYNNH